MQEYRSSRRTLYDCIGNRFEGIIKTQFPDMECIETDGASPDFKNKLFWLEAKTGFHEYGVQLKAYQINQFHRLDENPVVYALGFHTLEKAKTVLKNMNPEEMDAFLFSGMRLHSAYLITDEIIRKLWKKESRLAKSKPGWEYFSLKPRHLDCIIDNKQFKRKGTRHMPSRFYRIKRRNLLLQPAPRLQGRNSNLEFGAILDRVADSKIIQYLKRRNIIAVQ